MCKEIVEAAVTEVTTPFAVIMLSRGGVVVEFKRDGQKSYD